MKTTIIILTALILSTILTGCDTLRWVVDPVVVVPSVRVEMKC
jgi:hypothetical protein